MAYRVGLTKHEDSVSATVFDLPGCDVVAPTSAVVDQLLPIVIAEHVGWLTKYGEMTDETRPPCIEVVEEVDAASTQAADGEFCFQDDEQPATSEDVERAIRHMGYSRMDLLGITDRLPDPVLDWRPPKSAMAKIDPWNPVVLTIREIVASIAGSEGYYRTGLRDDEETGDSPNVADLEKERERFIARLTGLTEEERSHLFRPTRSWQERPEHWTVRKAARRVIAHERFHTKEIEQRLAWLLLGVPEFTRKAQEGATVDG